MYKIIEDRKRRDHLQEFEWERLSYMMALVVNSNPYRKGQSVSPTDFFKPSWLKDKPMGDQKMSKEEVLSPFPKKIDVSK